MGRGSKNGVKCCNPESSSSSSESESSVSRSTESDDIFDGCPRCISGKLPGKVLVTVSGVTSGVCAAINCNEFNKSYLLDIFNVGADCVYRLIIPDSPCLTGTGTPIVEFVLTATDVQVRFLKTSSGPANLVFREISSSKFNCLTLDITLPIANISVPTCGIINGTARVQAVL